MQFVLQTEFNYVQLLSPYMPILSDLGGSRAFESDTVGRGTLAAEISNAGKLLQQLSSRLEAAGIVSQVGSRRASAVIEGDSYLVKAIHGR
jgi:hypothetical protein